jgi:Na+/H+ antiporter NhaD/arsenite permease-like protein
MNLAWLSVGALATAIVLSCVTSVNVGVVSLAFAWIVGMVVGGMTLNDVLAGFPTQLFVTLAGVTLLFSMAQANGTLERVAERAVRLCRGNAGLIPIMFFFVALAVATIGPGNIATAALLAPMAMAVGVQAGVPAFLIAIMVGNGAQAGSLSPFAPTGVIVNNIMPRIGLAGAEWTTYAYVLAAHAGLTFGAYVLFGGWALIIGGSNGRRVTESQGQSQEVEGSQGLKVAESEGLEVAGSVHPLHANHWLTLVVLASLVTGVVLLSLPVGMVALTGAAILSLARAVEEREAIRRMPWNVILMVCGVTVLIAVTEKTQGMDLFVRFLASVSSRQTVTVVAAFVTGVVSVYSSTSGVVLPAFLPTVPGLIEQLGGGNPFHLAWSMIVGAHLVDMSPLSTTGALCLAAAPPSVDSTALFRKLLAWGLSMTVVGAFWCGIFFR